MVQAAHHGDHVLVGARELIISRTVGSPASNSLAIAAGSSVANMSLISVSLVLKSSG